MSCFLISGRPDYTVLVANVLGCGFHCYYEEKKHKTKKEQNSRQLLQCETVQVTLEGGEEEGLNTPWSCVWEGSSDHQWTPCLPWAGTPFSLRAQGGGNGFLGGAGGALGEGGGCWLGFLEVCLCHPGKKEFV